MSAQTIFCRKDEHPVPVADVAKPCAIGMRRSSDGSLVPSVVDIICPRCGKKHTHGFAPGYRVPHCATGDQKQYFIDLSDESIKGLPMRIVDAPPVKQRRKEKST